MSNVVRVFYKDGVWQVSACIKDHYLQTQKFKNDEQFAVNYAK